MWGNIRAVNYRFIIGAVIKTDKGRTYPSIIHIIYP